MPLLQGYKKRIRTQKVSDTEYQKISEWTSAESVECDNGKTVEESISSLEKGKANLASPTLTGTPKAPTASTGTNTAQIATTAFTQTAVSNHSSSTSAHSDIRDLIASLTTRLNTLADSDDTTLDQLSEIVAYIKNNKDLIDSITTDKVNVSDIINNLTSTVTNKPLAANQGKVLKDLIDALTKVVDSKANGTSLTSHTGNTTVHVTSENKTNWDAAKTHADSAHAPINAEANQNAFSSVKVGTTTITADSKTDTFELIAGSNVTLTPDSTNDKITIASKDTVYTHPESHPASMITGLPTSLPANGGNADTVSGFTVGCNVPANAKFTDTNTTYSDMKGATASAAGTHGLVPAPATGAQSKYLRGDGTWQTPPDNNTVYTHPTTSGNKHIPSGGASGQFLKWSADGTAVWASDNNTTYSSFVKSGSGAKAGLVPAPSTTAGTTKFLCEDGTWKAIANNKDILYSDAMPTSGLVNDVTWIGTAT